MSNFQKPKNLFESMIVGIDRSNTAKHLLSNVNRLEITEEAFPHVRDFLAQKFTPDLMDKKEVIELWNRITGEGKVYLHDEVNERRLKTALSQISVLLNEAWVLAAEHGAMERNIVRSRAEAIFRGILPGDEVALSVLLAELNLGEKE